jgi:type II secretory pathway predicted ATPase ExeA
MPSYLGRFLLVEAPFLPTPDARFVHRSESFGQVLDAVVRRIAQGDRLIVVTGDEGSGKTTLCHELSRSFPGRSAVTVVDDAHDLDDGRLEALLHKAGADETSGGTQAILVGYPRLEKWLQDMGALDARAVHRERLSPLHEREIKEYIERRLWVAQGGITALSGPTGNGSPTRLTRRNVRGPRFSDAAIGVITSASQGNPRQINELCDQILDRASGRASNRIGGRLVTRVVRDRGLPASRSTDRPRWLALTALGLAFGVVFVVAVLAYQNGWRLNPERPQRPAPLMRRADDDRPFQAFRKTTLDRAATLSTVPDVKGLLKLRDDVLLWEHEAQYENHQAVDDLLTEVERVTNDARARRLALDRQQFLQDAKETTK